MDVHTRRFDAADETAVRAVVSDAVERYGRLDVFFANAGIIGSTVTFQDVDEEDFMRTLRVNTLGCARLPLPTILKPSPYSVHPLLRGTPLTTPQPPYSPFLAAKHAAPAMQKTSADKPASSGSIIMTASVAGLRSNAGTTPYAASKAAVINMAATLAFQLAGTGIVSMRCVPGSSRRA